MLEIACFNAKSAIAAAGAGADRIELCADYSVGGVSPSIDTLRKTRADNTKPINAMVRPRPGDFFYSDEEFERMKSEIQLFQPEVNGFVFGILDQDGNVDGPRNAELVKLAAPLPCTFHRAFDQVPDKVQATVKLIDCGFSSILTSGGQPNAMQGANNVAELQQKFGNRIAFILGGSVRSSNIETLKETTGVPWYHSAALTGPDELVDAEEVAKLKACLS